MKTSKVFDTLAYSALHWPGKVSRLAADSLQDYIQRPVSPSTSIAELYHVNSKLYASKAAGLLAARTNAQEFRFECMKRAATLSAAGDSGEGVVVPTHVQRILALSTSSLDAEAFYAVEVRARLGERLLAWEPLNGRFAALKNLEKDDTSLLDAALCVMGRGLRVRPGVTLFLLGWFARNDLLLGPRGYRRTLLDAGRVLEALMRASHALAIEIDVYTEFTDVDVDRAIEADGVELGTLSVLVLSEPTDERR